MVRDTDDVRVKRRGADYHPQLLSYHHPQLLSDVQFHFDKEVVLIGIEKTSGKYNCKTRWG